MELKQTFANLQAWAKKHPKVAGGIAIGVVLLGVIVARRSPAGGGGASTAAGEDDSTGGNPIDGGSLDLSALGSSSSSMPDISGSLSMPAVTGGGASYAPSAPVLDMSSYNPNDFTGGGFSGDSYSNGGVSDYDSAPAPAYASAAAPASTSAVLGVGSKGTKGSSPSTATQTHITKPSTGTPNRQPVKTGAIVAHAQAGSSPAKYPPLLTNLKSQLGVGVASAGAGVASQPHKGGALNTAHVSSGITPAKPTPSKPVAKPAPSSPAKPAAAFAWYKTPFAARVWLPVATGKAMNYSQVK